LNIKFNLLELGICPVNIKSKLISILTFHKVDKKILEDADMAGPLLVLILFGFTLALVNLKLIINSKEYYSNQIIIYDFIFYIL